MTDCKQCGHCCTYLEFAVPNHPMTTEFYQARQVEMIPVNDLIVIRVPHRCPHLTDEMKCDIHETKPEACKTWPVFVDGWPDPCKGGGK